MQRILNQWSSCRDRFDAPTWLLLLIFILHHVQQTDACEGMQSGSEPGELGGMDSHLLLGSERPPNCDEISAEMPIRWAVDFILWLAAHAHCIMVSLLFLYTIQCTYDSQIYTKACTLLSVIRRRSHESRCTKDTLLLHFHGF
jgi:hypothetical protein